MTTSIRSKISKQEIIAFIVVIISAILFGTTVANAQGNGKARIKIDISENGKVTSIDTVVNVEDVDLITRKYDSPNAQNRSVSVEIKSDDNKPAKNRKKKGKGEEEKVIIRKFDSSSDRMRNGSDERNIVIEKNSDDEWENMRREMSDLQMRLKDEMEKIQGFTFELRTDDGEPFEFNFDVPPCPAMPPLPPINTEHSNFRFDRNHFSDLPDSLMSDDYLLIPGNANEAPPVLEKTIEGKDGQKIFVYKVDPARKSNKDMQKEERNTIEKLSLYPNPNEGRFSLSFNSKSGNDIVISIDDVAAKNVFNEKLEKFQGDYFKTFDFKDKAKGTYTLTVSSGDDTVIKKFVIQ